MFLALNKIRALFLVFFIFALDQFTKYLAYKYLAPGRTVKLLPFLNLVYVENPGGVFGMFKFLDPGFFIFVALVATSFLVYMCFKDSKNWLIYCLIISGALGNLTDRLIYGYVIDFIDFHVVGLHWPVFNLADSAISIGLVLFLYKIIKK